MVAIFDACRNVKHKTLLMTSYSGGLRLGETLALLPSDIDSARMMIRVEQGKGRKDRYVMLSPTLSFHSLRHAFAESAAEAGTTTMPSPPPVHARHVRHPRTGPARSGRSKVHSAHAALVQQRLSRTAPPACAHRSVFVGGSG